jgi:hypothetical protein
MADTETEPTPRERILAFMAAHRLTVESEFVPYSQSRNAKPRPGSDGKPWPSLNWKVRVMVQAQAQPGAARELVATDYSAGIGHAPAMKSSAAKRGPYSEKRNRDELAAWEIENGYPGAWGSMQAPHRAPRAKPIEPDPCDVLYSLASDSDVLDAGGFEEWAREFGYDTDSRSAEAIYRACLEIALKLRVGLGDDGLRALRDACRDF